MRLATLTFLAIAACASSALAQPLDVPPNGFAVSEDLSQLPEAVAQKREALLAIVAAGDIEPLGAILEADRTNVSFGNPDDKLESLKQNTDDTEGLAALAILGEVLDAPFAALDAGDGRLLYVWPWLAAGPDLAALTPAEKIEAYRLVGPEQFAGLVEYGGWLWWRVFIGEDGQLQAFVAGD
jgi:hypothetical protein